MQCLGICFCMEESLRNSGRHGYGARRSHFHAQRRGLQGPMQWQDEV